MAGDIVIVFDCGATNVRVIATDSAGNIVASESFINNTRPDPFDPSFRIWDIREIWEKMYRASSRVMQHIDKKRIAGATVTTFGVDAAVMETDGKGETKPIADNKTKEGKAANRRVEFTKL